ncbi:MAG: hypothetical protein E7059_07590 [Treponema bryantii]|nr:hypothetical protein [Treponema bryantii]
MKKLLLLFYALLLFNTNIYSTNKRASEELEKQEIAEKGYQTVNKLKSTYKERKWDGYSWRYRENKYDKNDKKMSKMKLLSTAWILPIDYNNDFFDFYLMFYEDDVFKFGGKSAGVLVTGKYKIKNNKVFLYPETNKTNDLLEFFRNTVSCFLKEKLSGKLKFSSDDIIFTNELVVDNLCFYPSETFKENGEKGFVKDIPVYSQLEKIVMTESVPLYSLPDINSEKLSNLMYEEIYKLNTNFLLKGSTLNILAKTRKAETINGKTDCWYYARIFGTDWYYHGWFFGKNFEKFDFSKKNEYERILEEEIKKYK